MRERGERSDGRRKKKEERPANSCMLDVDVRLSSEDSHGR